MQNRLETLQDYKDVFGRLDSCNDYRGLALLRGTGLGPAKVFLKVLRKLKEAGEFERTEWLPLPMIVIRFLDRHYIRTVDAVMYHLNPRSEKSFRNLSGYGPYVEKTLVEWVKKIRPAEYAAMFYSPDPLGADVSRLPAHRQPYVIPLKLVLEVDGLRGQCATCKYFLYYDGWEGTTPYWFDDDGLCTRYPPVFTGGDVGDTGSFNHPTVSGHGECGEWKWNPTFIMPKTAQALET